MVLGKPSAEGSVDLRFVQITFNKDADTNESLFERQEGAFKLQLSIDLSVPELKQKVAENIPGLEVGQFILRNPKGDDLGEVLLDTKSLDQLHLYDEKEIFV